MKRRAGRYSNADRAAGAALAAEVGQAEAARRLGVDPATVGRWVQAAQAAQPPPVQAPESPPVAELGTPPAGTAEETRLVRALDSARRHLEGAERDHSWTAVAKLADRVDALERELGAYRLTQAEAAEQDLSPEERLERLCAAIRRMPPQAVEAIMDVCTQRLGPRHLRVVSEEESSG